MVAGNRRRSGKVPLLRAGAVTGVLASVLVSLTTFLVVGAPAAWAAQTTTWGIVAAPSNHVYRSGMSHPADGRTVDDAVIVFNRTADPVTVELQVVATSFVAGAYQFGPPTTGLASRVSLPVGSVTLAAHQQARVPVTIREPRGVSQTELAGIAAEASAVHDGSLTIQQRLVVLVKATPSASLVPLPQPSPVMWGALAAAATAAVAVALYRQRRRVGVA